MATDAGFHRDLLLLPQDVSALNLSMTSQTLHVGNRMLLMAEENELRKFVEAIPANRPVRFLIGEQFLNCRALLLSCLVTVQAIGCLWNLSELTCRSGRMTHAALEL